MRKRGNWSVTDLTKLRALFGRRPIPQLARELRRTEETIRQKAETMFGGRRNPGPCSAEDESALREMVGISDLETMALVLGREVEAVTEVLRTWAGRKRRGRYQRWEIEFLKNFGASRPDWALALVLGREIAAVRRKAAELGLGKDRRLVEVPLPGIEKIVVLEPRPPRRMPRWSPSEVETLKRLFPETPNLRIARVLGRSISSVVAKANELRLRKSKRRLTEMGRENAGKRGV